MTDYPILCGRAEGAAKMAIIDLQSIVRVATGVYGHEGKHQLDCIVRQAHETITNLERMLASNQKETIHV